MKYKSLLGATLISTLAILTGCDLFKSDVPVNSVELNEAKITLSVGEDYVLEATVYPRNATNQKVSWTSSDDKAVIVSPDGLVYALSSGASIITVTTEDGGFTASCIVEVKGTGGIDPGNPSNQFGNGSLDSPFSAAGAIDFINGPSYNKDAKVYVKGKISSIKYPFSEEYGTAVFNISDDGKTSSTQFTCYSVYYLENKPWVNGYTQVSVGDDIIVYGKVTYYEKASSFETTEKSAFIYSLNGKTEAETVSAGNATGNGSVGSPYNADGVIKYIKSSTYKKDKEVYVKGKVSKITKLFNEESGVATFYISDNGKTSASQFACNDIYYLEDKHWMEGQSQIKVGDEVIAYGKVKYDEESSEYCTVTRYSNIYSLNGKKTAEAVNCFVYLWDYYRISYVEMAQSHGGGTSANTKELTFWGEKDKTWIRFTYSVPYYEGINKYWGEGTYLITDPGYWKYSCVGYVNGRGIDIGNGDYYEGTLKVTSSGNYYTFDFNLKNYSNTLTGHFEGSVL